MAIATNLVILARIPAGTAVFRVCHRIRAHVAAANAVYAPFLTRAGAFRLTITVVTNLI